LANYVEHLQPEIEINSCALLTVSTADVAHSAELRGALGAAWPFLSDAGRELIRELDIVDVTDKRYSPVAIPYTFVLDGNREIYKVYFGWWFVGRPTADELRADFRALLARGARPSLPPSLAPGSLFPDLELPDHTGAAVRLGDLMRGWPTIVTFARGLHSGEDRRQLANYAKYLYPDLMVSYCNLITVTVEDYLRTLELRENVGAYWPFLCDFDRKVIQELGLVDETDARYSPLARPITFVLHGDRRIHKVYDGGGYAGRPTADELIHDLRDVRSQRPDWGYPVTDPPTTQPPERLRPGRTFPDFELPDHDGQPARLSRLVGGWPTALTFIRGHY
jgi:peroxiredoxin